MDFLAGFAINFATGALVIGLLWGLLRVIAFVMNVIDGSGPFYTVSDAYFFGILLTIAVVIVALIGLAVQVVLS